LHPEEIAAGHRHERYASLELADAVARGFKEEAKRKGPGEPVVVL
jgi:hypothetical protein